MGSRPVHPDCLACKTGDVAVDDNDPSSETTVLGTLERRTIGDDTGQSRYTAFTYRADAGIIFRAGTTAEVGWVGQGQSVVLKDQDDALRDALQVAIGPNALRRTP